MKVHSFIKDTIAMEQNEVAAIAAKNVAYEHNNRVEASPSSSTGETASRPDTEETKEETGPTEEKKGKKGSRNKKNI